MQFNKIKIINRYRKRIFIMNIYTNIDNKNESMLSKIKTTEEKTAKTCKYNQAIVIKKKLSESIYKFC